MSSRVFEPLELLPNDDVPSGEVLASGLDPQGRFSGYPFSDIFPQEPYYFADGILGNYLGGDPYEGHPLYVAQEGLQAAYYDFARQERDNNFKRTEHTSRGLRATMLQKHIGSCVANGFDNVAVIFGPDTAVATIVTYIDAQNADKTTDYNLVLDHLTTLLASLDRGDEESVPDEIDGMPVISSRSVAIALGQIPESPEVERENRKDWTEKQIVLIRNRLMRLRFEYMSAMALTELLKRAVA